jgi:very-short-patch-repair endonuclease
VASDPSKVLAELGGCALLRDLLLRTSRWAVRAALARGEIERTAHGVYSLASASPAARASRAVHGVLSHQTAAAHWLMDGLSAPEAIHLTVPRNSRPLPRKGVIIHHADVPDERVTSPLRTVLDCARTLPFHEALAIADSACRIGLVSQEEVSAGALALRGPGRSRALRVAEHTDPAADNPFESGLRAILIETGISGFVTQLVIPDRVPLTRADLGDPRRRIVFEADSFTYHGDRRGLERDCRRYDELISMDWLVLRFAWEHVRFDRPWVSTMMRRTVDLRDRPPVRHTKPAAGR